MINAARIKVPALATEMPGTTAAATASAAARIKVLTMNPAMPEPYSKSAVSTAVHEHFRARVQRNIGKHSHLR
jgi:hypothetical protein